MKQNTKNRRPSTTTSARSSRGTTATRRNGRKAPHARAAESAAPGSEPSNRPVWRGHISFGLVSVPVALLPAERRTDIQLHMIDSRNLSRVRYERVNVETGEEVPWNQIVKGYEYADGSYVVITEEELKKASPRQTQAIDIEAFVELSEIDLTYFDRPYYVAPGKGGEKGYVLLRDVLRESGKAGVARVVIRTRQHLAALVGRDDVLVLNLLRFPQEIIPAAHLELPAALASTRIGTAERTMAKSLVDSMTAPWRPKDYHDEFRGALMTWIEERVRTGKVERVTEAEDLDEPPAPINIMDALRRSLDRTGRAGAADRSASKAPRRIAG